MAEMIFILMLVAVLIFIVGVYLGGAFMMFILNAAAGGHGDKLWLTVLGWPFFLGWCFWEELQKR